MSDQIIEVYLDDIIPNRFQPREKFNEDSINALANSIKKYGVIQPLVLRKIGDKFEIIAGERRFKASTIAGLEKVPAVIKNLNDSDSAEVALIENLQREDLTAIEKARSYDKLLKMSGETQETLSKKLGIAQPTLSNAIRLLSLDEEIQEALLDRKISERHARSLLQIKDNLKQREALKKIIDERMTVRSLDMYINEQNGTTGGEQKVIQPTESLGETLTPVAPVVEEVPIVAPPVAEAVVETPITAPPVAETVVEAPIVEPIEETPVAMPQPVEEEPKPIEINTFAQPSEEISGKVEKPNFDMLLKPGEENNEEEQPVTDFPKTVDLDVEKANMEVKIEEPAPVEAPIPQPEMFSPAPMPAEEKPVAEAVKPEETIAVPSYEVVKEQPKPPTQKINPIRTAINTIRQSIETVEKYGFSIDSDEMDLENEYQFIVTISKDKE